jgi:hypothetical protein
MMHLVFLDAGDHLETRFRSRLHARRHGDVLAQELLRQAVDPGGELFAFRPQESNDLLLVALRLFLGDDLLKEARKIEAL